MAFQLPNMASHATPVLHAQVEEYFEELLRVSGLYNVEAQYMHNPPPGPPEMYTYNPRSHCWMCMPCGKTVSWGHLTSRQHRNQLWEQLRQCVDNASLPAPPAPSASSAGSSWAGPTVGATTAPVPTASASAAAPHVQTAGPTGPAWAVPAVAAPTVPAPASPAAGAAAQAATTSALRSLENTIDTMQRDHQDAVDDLRQEIAQLRLRVDGGLQQATQHITELRELAVALGADVVHLQEQVRTLQNQNDEWYQRRDEWRNQ